MRPGHCYTAHEDVCGWCQKICVVTEPRDWAYPRPPDPIDQTALIASLNAECIRLTAAYERELQAHVECDRRWAKAFDEAGKEITNG